MTNHLSTYEIPERRREFYFRILNGEQNFNPITLRFHFLEDHFPKDKLDLALVWLIKNNVVGKAFLTWFKAQCHGSDLEMHSRLLSIVQNAAIAPIIAGKNFHL